MKRSPATHLVNKAIIEIKALADGLDSANANKLASDLQDLESKISALQSFLVDHIVRKA
jgi:hypothetical protein